MARGIIATTAAALGLLFTGCDGSQGETLAVGNLAVHGATKVYAEGNAMCPPDKPDFKGGKCRGACESGHQMLDSGFCQSKKVSCKKKEKKIGNRCYRNITPVKVEQEKLINCYKNRVARTCKCEPGLKLKIPPRGTGLIHEPKEFFCYSDSYIPGYASPSSDLKPNCQGISTGLCGHGGYSHCTVKFDTCVWNTTGFPDCTISGNTASCFNTE